MKWTVNGLFLMTMVLGVCVWTGCGPGTSGEHADEEEHADHADEADHGDEDGDDDHHAPHGSHNGHIFELDCEGRFVEWVDIGDVADDEESTVVYMLEKKDGKYVEQPVSAASKMTIETKPKEGEAKTFEFRPVNAEGEPAMASQFVADQDGIVLNVNLAAEAGGTITLTVDIDGKPCKATLERHEH